MDEVRRRTEQTLHTLRELLEVSRRVRDTARDDGREEFARHEDDSIVELEKRIAWLGQQKVEFEERQARRMGEG
jgi:predicted RNA binding protein with dsRBD fold (UPF0201 family)